MAWKYTGGRRRYTLLEGCKLQKLKDYSAPTNEPAYEFSSSYDEETSVITIVLSPKEGHTLEWAYSETGVIRSSSRTDGEKKRGLDGVASSYTSLTEEDGKFIFRYSYTGATYLTLTILAGAMLIDGVANTEDLVYTATW